MWVAHGGFDAILGFYNGAAARMRPHWPLSHAAEAPIGLGLDWCQPAHPPLQGSSLQLLPRAGQGRTKGGRQAAMPRAAAACNAWCSPVGTCLSLWPSSLACGYVPEPLAQLACGYVPEPLAQLACGCVSELLAQLAPPGAGVGGPPPLRSRLRRRSTQPGASRVMLELMAMAGTALSTIRQCQPATVPSLAGHLVRPPGAWWVGSNETGSFCQNGNTTRAGPVTPVPLMVTQRAPAAAHWRRRCRWPART
jgi:hypothetical protein